MDMNASLPVSRPINQSYVEISVRFMGELGFWQVIITGKLRTNKRGKFELRFVTATVQEGLTVANDFVARILS
tara:strand:+ start:442 stop:660 length:219 start_codon:yes stop_codon:yes gene_type:complete